MNEDTIRLSELLAVYGKDKVAEYLKGFRCNKDPDLQIFLHEKAIMYEDKGRSRTYLFIDSENKRIIGYVTLSLTKIRVSSKSSLVKGVIRKMDLNDGETVGYLIGQMAKDDSVEEQMGHRMLSFAKSMLHKSYMQNGGRVICIDCKGPLVDYYRKEGFLTVEPDPNEKNGLYRLVSLF